MLRPRLTVSRPEPKLAFWRALTVVQSIEPTDVSRGMLRVNSVVMLVIVKSPSIDSRLLPWIADTSTALTASRSPSIAPKLPKSMIPVAPVAMATFPVKVLQPDSPVASALFSIVVVEALQSWAVATSSQLELR